METHRDDEGHDVLLHSWRIIGNHKYAILAMFSIGAAIAAGVGVGVFSSMAEGAETISIEQERAADPERASAYGRLFDVYAALYPRLKPVYRRLQESMGG